MLQTPNKAGPEDRAGVERPLSPNPSPPGPSGDDGAESNFLSVIPPAGSIISNPCEFSFPADFPNYDKTIIEIFLIKFIRIFILLVMKLE